MNTESYAVRRRSVSLIAAACAAAALAVVWVVTPASAQARADGRPAALSGTDRLAVTPPGREWASFAYYPPQNELVLFGGHTFSTVFGDTWTRKGTTWTHQHPASSPSPRTGAAMVYDPATQQLLLFGGGNPPGAGFMADTWSWNGTTWTQLHPATSPPTRQNGDLVYDAATNSVILFGGFAGTYRNDTWSWNGTTWTQLHPATSPSGRDSHDFVYDAATTKAIMFGGFRGTGYSPGDTWSWSGTNWTQLSPPTSPGVDVVAWQGAYDAASSQLLMFGGDAGGKKPFLNSTWTWTGTTWTQLHPATSPPGRAYGSMTYDTATKQVVLFAGRANSPTTSFPTTAWAWNGTTWTQI